MLLVLKAFNNIHMNIWRKNVENWYNAWENFWRNSIFQNTSSFHQEMCKQWHPPHTAVCEKRKICKRKSARIKNDLCGEETTYAIALGNRKSMPPKKNYGGVCERKSAYCPLRLLWNHRRENFEWESLFGEGIILRRRRFKQ